MNINAAFPSTYLKAADLQGRSASVVMDRVSLEEIGGEHKPVLYFAGKERGLVLNKTNSSIIAEMHGSETDDWAGKSIVLYPARVEFQGRIVDAIRIKLDVQSRPAPITPRPHVNGSPPRNGQHTLAASAVPVIDDDIPF